MKNLLLILTLFVVIPSTMGISFIDDRQESTIIITDDLMICKSYFEPVHDKPIHYLKPLKIGENNHYFVPFNGMSVNIEIIKY